ncbi:unnamed protein product [Polarella glacialis]|uniref:EF-hand domain-containing protein n=1 Tax=Polarella glacialis TaxID=89957 RepID=A0A813EG91_POLGL|nr:unnamed protein product [Polarella glacialis]
MSDGGVVPGSGCHDYWKSELLNSGLAGFSHRLSFPEFAERLARVHIPDFSEQMVLFNAVCHCKTGRTSIAELGCAVATVSPSLLLEDVRDKMIKKYLGDFEKAFTDLDMDHGGSVDQEEFVLKASAKLSLSDHEARKCFRDIDIDGSGEVSRAEFLSAIGLSEPSLFLEDLRTKVRQRFHSIQEQFAIAFSDSMTADLHASPKLTMARFQELLEPLDMRPNETRAFFQLVDANQDNGVSVREFMKSLHHFAPSCALEDLRQRCFQVHSKVSDAFEKSTEDYAKLLDQEAFAKQLIILGLYDVPLATRGDVSEISAFNPGVKVAGIFDFLDVTNSGQASLGRLIAALNGCGAGSSVRLNPEELNLRAKQDVRGDMAPMHRLIFDIKSQVRLGKTFDAQKHSPQDTSLWDISGSHISEVLLADSGGERRASQIVPRTVQKFLSGGAKGAAVGGNPPPGQEVQSSEQGLEGSRTLPPPQSVREKEKDASGSAPPRLKTRPHEEVASFTKKSVRVTDPKGKEIPVGPSQNMVAAAQNSWGRLWVDLHKSPGAHHRVNLSVSLQNYFQTAAWSLSHDLPLVNGPKHSRLELQNSVKAHQEALRRRAQREFSLTSSSAVERSPCRSFFCCCCNCYCCCCWCCCCSCYCCCWLLFLPAPAGDVFMSGSRHFFVTVLIVVQLGPMSILPTLLTSLPAIEAEPFHQTNRVAAGTD